MLQTLVLASVLTVVTDPGPYTPEEEAVGAMREVVSAQAVHKQQYPQMGYACGLERLVETGMLQRTWLEGKRVAGYTFRVWCDPKAAPQATFRASGVRTKKANGASLTVCADESNAVRTVEGDVGACLAKGVAAK